MGTGAIGRLVRGFLVLAVVLSTPGPEAAAADPPSSPDVGNDTTQGTAADEQDSRLQRVLKRYFGNHAPSGESLQGRAERAVDRYRPSDGAYIEVVLVHPVDRFEESGADDPSAARRMLDSLTRPLQSYTRDGVIRDFLLFRRGEKVDPYLLADSERLLRRLNYISDARIEIVPLNARADTVAIVVQTADRWPLGADADIKGVSDYRASVYSVNVLGSGLGISNELLYREAGSPDTGYRGLFRKENLQGNFLDVEGEYEDSYLERQTRLHLQRVLAHPEISLVGGVSWDRLRQRREEIPANEVIVTDSWGGVVHRMYDRRGRGRRSRPVLVPAVRIIDRRYRDRPAVTEDLNRSYHESRLYLGGLYYQRVSYYRTSFLLGLGETESVPRGFVGKISGGYQDGEFSQRVCVFTEAGAVSVRDRGDVVLGSLGWGGYFRNRRIEQGLFRAGAGYYAALVGEGRYRMRFSGRAEYLLGIRRAEGELLSLRPRQGLQVLPNEEVQGGQRLTSVWEASLFTPWSLAGFRVSCFAFLDAGVVGPEKAASLLQEKLYFAGGMGVNLRNPDLALPTWRIFFAVKNRVEDHGATFQLGFKTVPQTVLDIPGPKPATPVYR